MTNKIKVLTAIATLMSTVLVSCLTNDIPYPHIQANIQQISAEGQERNPAIDSTNCTVTFYLAEDVNIYNVVIDSYRLTPGATVPGDTIGPLDLSEPQKINVHLYYDYEWTLQAVQTVERYFTLENQIGNATIDVPARRVIAYVNEHADLANLRVTSLKLGADGSTMTPDIVGRTVDFSHPVEVVVTNHGHRETWTIYIDVTASLVNTERVDAWTNVAWVYGQGEDGADFGVQYRLKGDSEWTDVPAEWLTIKGGAFHARILHLSPSTTYEARCVAGDDSGAVVEFTTGFNFQCPNMDFASWWLDGKVWCPWPEGGEQYWDTGNKGATTLGSSNVTPTDDTPFGTGQAALLKTEFKGIGALGKLAAGSIFVGKYVRTDGTNGILSFGRECSQRPTRLRGYFKFTTAPITDVTTGFEALKGKPDTCIIWCSLIDSDEPFEIRTNPKNQHLFDPAGSYVVAYGKHECGETVSTYIPFEFELNYTATNRVPKYILLTGAASKYGDYFTGGRGATLWLADLELLYDY